MYTISQAFKDFISPTCNRTRFIQDYLKAGGVDSVVMSLEGKNHIYVKFPPQHYNPMFRIKTVIAQYDRIGIGANYNSAAVFCLMEWARGLPFDRLRDRMLLRDYRELRDHVAHWEHKIPAFTTSGLFLQMAKNLVQAA